MRDTEKLQLSEMEVLARNSRIFRASNGAERAVLVVRILFVDASSHMLGDNDSV